MQCLSEPRARSSVSLHGRSSVSLYEASSSSGDTNPSSMSIPTLPSVDSESSSPPVRGNLVGGKSIHNIDPKEKSIVLAVGEEFKWHSILVAPFATSTEIDTARNDI